MEGATYVIFDVETTGLSAIYDRVIELSAVKMQGKEVIDQFEEFIDPGFHLSDQTTELTSITDDMVKAPSRKKKFLNCSANFMAMLLLLAITSPSILVS